MIAELKAQFPIFQNYRSEQALHYLDNAATTFMPERGLLAMDQFERNSRANIQRGMYDLGIEATELYAKARQQVASYLGVSRPEQLVFNSGTTMGINQLAYGLEPLLSEGDEIVISLAEHHSNFLPWQMLAQRLNLKLGFIPVDNSGSLNLAALADIVTSRCKIVAITQVSNVTGEQMDISAVVRAASEVGAKVIIDGAQAVAHGPVNVPEMGVDAFAFSGHKCFGPTGIGVLWLGDSLQNELMPMLTGGGMVDQVGTEISKFARDGRRFEAGTPAITQAIGLGEVLQWLAELPWDTISQHEQSLSGQVMSGLKAIPGIKLLGPDNLLQRRPIFSFELAGAHPHDIAHILNQSGVAVRAGHHCAQPLMTELGMNATTRVSCAFYNTKRDIEALLQGMEKVRELLL